MHALKQYTRHPTHHPTHHVDTTELFVTYCLCVHVSVKIYIHYLGVHSWTSPTRTSTILFWGCEQYYLEKKAFKDAQFENLLKGIGSPKNENCPMFTHPQAILEIYPFLLTDEHNQSYIKKCPYLKLYKQ